MMQVSGAEPGCPVATRGSGLSLIISRGIAACSSRNACSWHACAVLDADPLSEVAATGVSSSTTTFTATMR